MPQLVTVRVAHPGRRPTRVWVPVLPVVLLLSPILVLAVVVAAAACLFYGVSVLRALAAGWRIFAGLRGTRIDISEGRTALLLIIS